VVDVFNARIVCPAFDHDDFVGQAIVVDCLFEEHGARVFVNLFAQLKSTVSLCLSTARYQ
jgi:hypothetical protein